MTQETSKPPPAATPAQTRGILFRPPQYLQELPLEYQWEVTRRHPYYLAFWQQARRYYDPDLDENTDEGALAGLAVSFLVCIGVHDVPLPPPDRTRTRA